MYDDLQALIKGSNVSDEIKVTLSIITKGVSWFPWVFIGVGIFLNKEFFSYWLAFSLFIFGALIIVLLYMLVMVLHFSLTEKPRKESSDGEGENVKKTNFPEIVMKGIIGNFSFYFFIMAVFVVIKSMDIFDSSFQSVLDAIKSF